jgi:hypothetical protein
MKKIINYSLILAVAASAFMFTACEDGDPGVSGPQGEQGTKGDTGDAGDDGLGFGEAAQYGNIVVTFKGTRIDDQPFEKTLNFKFAVQGPDLAEDSYVSKYDNEGNTGFDFSATRFHSVVVPDETMNGSNSNAGFDFSMPDDGNQEGLIIRFGVNVGIVSDDFKYFLLDHSREYQIDETVTEYSFNAATGELKFKFNTISPADDNDTDHALEITADVNVKVVENIGWVD